MKYPFLDTQLSLEERAQNLVELMTAEEKAGQMLHQAKAIPRLGIPEYNWWNECLHGVARAGKATVFPQAIGLAAMFDSHTHHQIAQAISTEARAKYEAAQAKGNRSIYRGLTFWTPNINIFRDPRWGRGQETYGESPFLTAQLGTAFVQGLQGDHPEKLKTAACAKHFAVHNGPEALRHEFDAQVSPKDLEETYLPAFKALVTEGKVESVMGAYNRVNGEPSCGSKTLLKDILRDQWGFKGHVVSDCWAVRDFHQGHGVTQRPEESVALALSMGCDLNCGCTYDYVLKALEEELISQEHLNQSVKRLMLTRLKLGMFDPPEANPFKHISMDAVDSPEHRKLALKAAEKSMVLLKNNGVLPLGEEINRIYVTGPNASNVDGLIANYYGANPRLVTPYEGICAAAPEGTTVEYRPGVTLYDAPKNDEKWAVYEAGNSDVTIAVMGLDSTLEGEEGDAIASSTKGDREDIGLPEHQLEFLRDLKKQGKPLVVVILAGCAMAIPQVEELADGLIFGWYPGEEGGTALANVLFGHVSPAGKLPVTFPRSVDQLPPFEDYSMEGRTFRYMTEKPLFPFGYGLTYTDWDLGEAVIQKNNLQSQGVLQLQLPIRNIGDMASDQVVQLYISVKDAPFPVPRWELRGFQRVHLEAGETRNMDFTLQRKHLESVDLQGQRHLLPGRITIHMGFCSPGSRSGELEKSQGRELTIDLA